MKMIVAYLQPFMAKEVVHALHQVDGVTGATFAEVRGFGAERRTDVSEPEVLYGTSLRTRVEVVVPDALERTVVLAIRNAAHTGRRGDGKIFVLQVNSGVRIASGAESDGDTVI